jgi:hypothetical protein
MKPDTRAAMGALIRQVRRSIPFELPEALLCAGPCSGCSKKLLEYLDRELQAWEWQLARGDTPRLGDIQSLAKRCRKIHGVLERNGLLASVTAQGGESQRSLTD